MSVDFFWFLLQPFSTLIRVSLSTSLEYYGPRYKLEVLDNNMENQNSREYLENIKNRVIDTLRNMPFAPSTGMHEVPRMSVGKALGIVGEDDEDSGEESDIDGQINRAFIHLYLFQRDWTDARPIFLRTLTSNPRSQPGTRAVRRIRL